MGCAATMWAITASMLSIVAFMWAIADSMWVVTVSVWAIAASVWHVVVSMWAVSSLDSATVKIAKNGKKDDGIWKDIL